MKKSRPKSPCAKCGGSERNAARNCIPCYRDYMREYKRKWRENRRKEKA